jgi:hypothetical protein
MWQSQKVNHPVFDFGQTNTLFVSLTSFSQMTVLFSLNSFAELVAGTTDLHQTFARCSLLVRVGIANADGSLTKAKPEAMCLSTSPCTEFDHADEPVPFHISPAHHMHFEMSFANWAGY